MITNSLFEILEQLHLIFGQSIIIRGHQGHLLYFIRADMLRGQGKGQLLRIVQFIAVHKGVPPDFLLLHCQNNQLLINTHRLIIKIRNQIQDKIAGKQIAVSISISEYLNQKKKYKLQFNISAKMSRTYFKNQLYFFALEKEKQAQIIEDKKKEEETKKKVEEKRAKFVKTEKGAAIQQQKKIRKEEKQKSIKEIHMNIHVDDSLTIKSLTQQGSTLQQKQDEKQFLKSMKKKDSNGNINANVAVNTFKPLSKLVVKEELVVQKNQKEQKKLKINEYKSFKSLQSNLKNILYTQAAEVTSEKKEEQKKTKYLEKTGVKQNEGDNQKEEGQGKEQNKQGDDKQKKVKTKKIKKQNNYVRLDLKRKYQQKFTGKINEYRRKFNKNGRIKNKYRIQAQIGLQDGEFYNNYISSLSSALCMTIDLGDDDSQDSSEEHQSYENQNTIEWDRESLTAYMKRFFGFETFREGQYETILNILNKKSTIFVSETASGKSLTYILSSMLLGGLSIVISPLVSLMLDQLNHLPKRFPAACISSLINREQRNRIIKMIHEGKVNLLFITPQSLQTDFIYHLQDFPAVNFVCIDEAHSLSELSHNFRTSFLALGDIVQNIIKYKSEKPTILGLTATANIQTVASIREKLNIDEQIRSNKTMNKNIYITISKEKGLNKYDSLIKYLHIPIIYKCRGILIYTRTRWIMDQVFNYVTNSSSFSVAKYHSALSSKEKTTTLKEFRDGTKKIVIATIALGMGLDFQNLQCVIHINMPKSIENYVQEVGRAGRRQRRAYCHLFLDQNDYITERNYIIADLLEKPLLKLLYSCLKMYSKENFEKTKEKKPRKIKEKPVEQQKAIKRSRVATQKIQEEDNEYLQKMYEKSEQQQFQMITIKKLQNISSLEEIKIMQKQEEERERVIKIATLMLELTKKADNNDIIINEEEDQDQFEADKIKNKKEQAQFYEQEEEELEIQQKNINTKLFYARSEKLKELTQLRQEVILTLLIKIESLLKDDKDIKFRVLPLSFEQIKIGFFKNNQAQVKKESQFYRQLVHGCKVVRGTTYVNLIRKCNLLGLKPIQLLANLYRLSNVYTIKIQLETPVFIWQFQGKKDNSQSFQQMQLGELVQRGFQKLLSDDYIDKVVSEVNSVQKTSITKINIFFSLAFNYSRLHMANIIQRNLIIPHQQEIGEDCITKEFDNYFKSNLQEYYMKITDNEKQIVIPTEMISKQDQNEIYSWISKFFKDEIANVIDARNREEYRCTLRQLFGKYQNGKVITKIMMGVTAGEVSWRIYKDRKYWMVYKLKNYDQLLQTVQEQVKRYRENFQAEPV